jgi:hypothetical protein
MRKIHTGRLRTWIAAMALLISAVDGKAQVGGSTGMFSELAPNELKRVVSNYGASVSAGATSQFFAAAGPGTVKEFLLAISPINTTQIGRGTAELIVAVDGTTVIDCDVGTLFGANFANTGARFETEHMALDLVMPSAGGAGYYFRFWMPFRSSITLSVKNNEAASPITIWTDVVWAPNEFYPWKLKGAAQPFLAGMPSALVPSATGSYISPASQGNQSVIYLNSAATGDASGSVVWHSNSYIGGSTTGNLSSIVPNQSYMENRVVAFLDGQSTGGTPAWDSSGTEEYFGTGFYGIYSGQSTISTAVGPTFYESFNAGTATPLGHVAGSTVVLAADLLARFGGIKWNTGIVLTQIAKPPGYVQSSAYVFMSWVVLYYTPYP